MNKDLKYGFDGCTPEQRSNHRHWCNRNGYQPYNLYRKIADAVIARRQATIQERAARFNEDRRLACGRPKWMSRASWKSYREYERRSIKLGFPSITPEEWADENGTRGRRPKIVHPDFTPSISRRFRRCNRQRRYDKLPEYTPEEYLEWLRTPKAPNGKRIRTPKPKKPKVGLVFTKPKAEIISKILMATTPMRIQNERSRTREADSRSPQEHGAYNRAPCSPDEAVEANNRIPGKGREVVEQLDNNQGAQSS